MLHQSSLGGQHLVVLLVSDYDPPEFLLFLREVATHHELLLQRLVSAQLNLDLHFVLLPLPKDVLKSQSWVSIAGLSYLLDVFPFQRLLSFFLFHIHELGNVLNFILLIQQFGRRLVQDLQQRAFVYPHRLHQHLAELHTKYERLQMT